MATAMSIPAVTALLARCWMSAETLARDLLAQRHPDKDEEFVTEFFHDEFRQAVVKASTIRAVERAFVADLARAFPKLQQSGDLRRLANGISATTTLHPREIERRSGGDLGIVLVRPNVIEHMRSQLAIDRDYQRGLLCQAKIKRRKTATQNSAWGNFTPNQKKILPNRLHYLSLILYEYTDAGRQHLAPFRWQLCSGAQFSDVEQWLNCGEFPELLPSDAIITRLGRDRIGTDDKHIIDQYISPKVRDTLKIKIGWPPGQEPPAYVRFYVQPEQQREQVHVYR